MKKLSPIPYTGEIKITARIDWGEARRMRRARKLEEAAKKNFGKIKVDNFIMSNAARVSFEVSRERWQEIEQSPEWAAVKGVIETELVT